MSCLAYFDHYILCDTMLFSASNILVHQYCTCRSPLMCICPEGNKTLYVLGDMDLLCTEGECSLIKSEVWKKMAMHEPAGTIEMKPPEVMGYTILLIVD